jgi:hypothetical protein
LPDIAVPEIPVDEQERPLPAPEPSVHNALVDGPILRTLLWLAWPNVIALSAGTCVVIAETSYIGRLGVESLAAMALVFPFVILTMTMSGGAMGGGVSSAIARALGAGDKARASALAVHALMIGGCFGLTITLIMLVFGPALLELLGGHGNVLALAIGYAQIFFGGAVLPWLMNTLGAILRGTGNMKLPSLIILNSAVCQIVLGGILGLGLGPVPQFGMRGVAAGSLTAYSIGGSIMAWYIFSGRARVTPVVRGLRIRRGMFFDISESRRRVLFLAAAVGTDDHHPHPHAGAVRNPGPGRIRHRRSAGIHADLDRFRGRNCVGADGRNGDRRGTGGAGATHCADRRLRVVRLGRPRRQRDCDLPRPLGGYFHA